MSGRLMVNAMAFAHFVDAYADEMGNHYATHSATPARVFVTSSELRNVTAPRMSAACPLNSKLFALVAAAPTAWCTADLDIDGLNEQELCSVPAVFRQLRRIGVFGWRVVHEPAAVMLAGVCAAGTIREIILDLSGLRDAALEALAPFVGRLEALELEDCSAMTGEVLRDSLRGMTRMRVFRIGHARTMTDDDLAVMLAESPQLESLTVRYLREFTGAFLAALPEECHVGMREIQISSCDAFDDAGAAHLAHFRGLRAMNVQQCPRVTSLPLARMPPLRRTGACFMYENMGLTTLDLSVLANITVVDAHFLRDCRSLTALDVSPLKHVVSVDDGFLHGCEALSTLDLSAMTNVVAVGDGFLTCCDLLRRLRLSDALLRHPAVSDEHKRLHAETGCDGGW